jgi:hypothetical protein
MTYNKTAIGSVKLPHLNVCPTKLNYTNPVTIKQQQIKSIIVGLSILPVLILLMCFGKQEKKKLVTT